MSKPFGQKKPDLDEEEENAKEAVEKQQRDFKSNLMEEEYKRISANIQEVDSYCNGLTDKVDNFREKMDDAVNQLKIIDEEEVDIDCFELKDKLEDGREELKRLNEVSQIHSDCENCVQCGKNHNSGDCNNQTIDRKNATGISYAKTAQNFKKQTSTGTDFNNKQEDSKDNETAKKLLADKLKHLSPNLLKDMLKRKKKAEDKQKKRLWDKMTKEQKQKALEKEAADLNRDKFQKEADLVRERVKEQYAEVAARETKVETNYILEKIDEEKGKIKEELLKQKDERALIINEHDDNLKDKPENKEKIEEIRIKHEQLMEDQRNPEKLQELKQNQIDIHKQVLFTKDIDVENLNLKEKFGLDSGCFEDKASYSQLMKILDVDHTEILDKALDNIVEKRKIDINNVSDKNMRTMSISINHTLQKNGAAILTDQKDVDKIIEDYIKRKQVEKKEYDEKVKNGELNNYENTKMKDPDSIMSSQVGDNKTETMNEIWKNVPKSNFNIKKSMVPENNEKAVQKSIEKVVQKSNENYQKIVKKLNENKKSNKKSTKLNNEEKLHIATFQVSETSSGTQFNQTKNQLQKSAVNDHIKVKENTKPRAKKNIKVKTLGTSQDRSNDNIQDNEEEDIQDSDEEDIQDNEGEVKDMTYKDIQDNERKNIQENDEEDIQDNEREDKQGSDEEDIQDNDKEDENHVNELNSDPKNENKINKAKITYFRKLWILHLQEQHKIQKALLYLLLFFT